MLEVGKVYTIYEKSRVVVDGKLADFGCSKMTDVEVLKINKQSYSLKEVKSGKKLNIRFDYGYDKDWCRVYKEGTLEGYKIIENEEQRKQVLKEFEFYILVSGVKGEIKSIGYDIESTNEKIDKLMKEIERLKRINDYRESKKEGLEKGYAKGMEILKELKGEC